MAVWLMAVWLIAVVAIVAIVAIVDMVAAGGEPAVEGPLEGVLGVDMGNPYVSRLN